MGKQRVKLTFPPHLITRPIIWEMGHRFPVVTNIRRADVREDYGWVVLELSGEESAIQQALEWARGLGVRVDLATGDVVEG
ncbi:MAG: NIL domain-containing protein [Chloroflexota bacterium]|nr:NIL domain-containing protein [Chloroflexota bacterium]